VRIAIASVSQETCSFNSVLSDIPDFEATRLEYGDDIVQPCDSNGTISGFLSAMPRSGWQPFGIIDSRAMAGGTLKDSALEFFRARLVAGLRNVKDLDALYISLHGAMAAQTIPDAEGSLLTTIRELVGPDCFICATLDHHANVTPEMVAAADLMVGYETQPHQLIASGRKTARVMADVLAKKRAPQAALAKVPMLAPQDNFLTASGPMKEWFDLAREMEKDDEVIVASTFPTQPWLDVPNNGWSCLVYATRQAKAQACADALAQKAWALRDRFWKSDRLPVSEAIRQAATEPRGLVVISDTGDAVFGGAPGDNVTLLAEMLKQDWAAAALVPVVDREALREALAAGIGQTPTLEIGGRMSVDFSPRLTVTGVVVASTKAGTFVSRNQETRIGRTVLLKKDNVNIVLMETRDYAINHPDLYGKLGIRVETAQAVVLKTGSNFQFFTPYQSRLIRADSPGATQSTLQDFRWKHLAHPMYPFDPVGEHPEQVNSKRSF